MKGLIFEPEARANNACPQRNWMPFRTRPVAWGESDLISMRTTRERKLSLQARFGEQTDYPHSEAPWAGRRFRAPGPIQNKPTMWAHEVGGASVRPRHKTPCTKENAGACAPASDIQQ